MIRKTSGIILSACIFLLVSCKKDRIGFERWKPDLGTYFVFPKNEPLLFEQRSLKSDSAIVLPDEQWHFGTDTSIRTYPYHRIYAPSHHNQHFLDSILYFGSFDFERLIHYKKGYTYTLLKYEDIYKTDTAVYYEREAGGYYRYLYWHSPYFIHPTDSIRYMKCGMDSLSAPIGALQSGISKHVEFHFAWNRGLERVKILTVDHSVFPADTLKHILLSRKH